MSANSIIILTPYKYNGVWVFDDERVDLVKEPFVCGIDEMIDKITADILDADKGFTLLISQTPIPDSCIHLEWRREQHGGNWYYSKKLDKEGWLCPALYKYFDTAPSDLYAVAKKLNE